MIYISWLYLSLGKCLRNTTTNGNEIKEDITSEIDCAFSKPFNPNK